MFLRIVYFGSLTYSYRKVLGMMQEDVDWFIKQVDELVDEYAKEVKVNELRERVNGMLQQMLLSKDDLKEKYGVKYVKSDENDNFLLYWSV